MRDAGQVPKLLDGDLGSDAECVNNCVARGSCGWRSVRMQVTATDIARVESGISQLGPIGYWATLDSRCSNAAAQWLSLGRPRVREWTTGTLLSKSWENGGSVKKQLVMPVSTSYSLPGTWINASEESRRLAS
jgi:hypothetical protein